jgi:hypothetical protein
MFQEMKYWREGDFLCASSQRGIHRDPSVPWTSLCLGCAEEGRFWRFERFSNQNNRLAIARKLRLCQRPESVGDILVIGFLLMCAKRSLRMYPIDTVVLVDTFVQ